MHWVISNETWKRGTMGDWRAYGLIYVEMSLWWSIGWGFKNWTRQSWAATEDDPESSDAELADVDQARAGLGILAHWEFVGVSS